MLKGKAKDNFNSNPNFDIEVMGNQVKKKILNPDLSLNYI